MIAPLTTRRSSSQETQSKIPVFETADACAGSVASYVLRRIASRAGTYAPGIQDAIFHELHTSHEGRTIGEVARWFAGRRCELLELGYRLELRRVSLPTPDLVAWIQAGHGYRGAVLLTNCGLLYRATDGATAHTIGLSVERSEPDADDELVMTDASPAAQSAHVCPSSTLEPAHRDRDFLALAFHWIGWS